MEKIDLETAAWLEGWRNGSDFLKNDPERAQALLGSVTVEPLIDSPTLNKAVDNDYCYKCKVSYPRNNYGDV